MNPSPSPSTGRPGRNFDGSKGRGFGLPAAAMCPPPCSSLGSVSSTVVAVGSGRSRSSSGPLSASRSATAASRASSRPDSSSMRTCILVARFAEGGQTGQDKAERFDEPGRRRLGLVVVVRLGSSPSNSSSVMDRNMTAAIRPSISPMRSSTSSSVACWRATSASSTFGRASTGAASSGGASAAAVRKRPLAEEGVPDDPRRLLPPG